MMTKLEVPAKINDTPEIKSILKNLELLPEQVTDGSAAEWQMRGFVMGWVSGQHVLRSKGA